MAKQNEGGNKGTTARKSITNRKQRSNKGDRHQQVVLPKQIDAFGSEKRIGGTPTKVHHPMHDFEQTDERGTQFLCKPTGEVVSRATYEAIRKERENVLNSIASSPRPAVQLHRGRKASTAAA